MIFILRTLSIKNFVIRNTKLEIFDWQFYFISHNKSFLKPFYQLIIGSVYNFQLHYIDKFLTSAFLQSQNLRC